MKMTPIAFSTRKGTANLEESRCLFLCVPMIRKGVLRSFQPNETNRLKQTATFLRIHVVTDYFCPA